MKRRWAWLLLAPAVLSGGTAMAQDAAPPRRACPPGTRAVPLPSQPGGFACRPVVAPSRPAATTPPAEPGVRPPRRLSRGGFTFRRAPAIGTRMFVPARLDPPRGFGAVGVIAFPRPPADEAERRRAIAICQAFLTVLPDSREVSAQAPDRPQMVTLWPRTDIAAPLSYVPTSQAVTSAAACASAVDGYAYIAADGWLAELPPQVRPGPAARGPVLIAWAPPASRGDPRAPVLTYDLSHYEQPATIVQAFGVWKSEIEGRPDLWRNGWDQTRWRLEAAARVDRYGAAILDALKLLPFVGDGR